MEKQISSKKIFDGTVLKVNFDIVELDDGRRGEREVVHHPGGCCLKDNIAMRSVKRR